MGLRDYIRNTEWYKHYKAYKASKVNDERYLTKRHKSIFGYTPDFKNPKTFNEKIIHRILFDRNPLYTALADKLKARIYIASTLANLNATQENCAINNCGGGGGQNSSYSTTQSHLDSKESITSPNSPLFQPIDTLTQALLETNSCPYLPKLYGIYKSVEEIDFKSLPQSFVLKTNHDCGGVVLVPDKESFLKDYMNFYKQMSFLNEHLHTNYYEISREWHYNGIEPRVFAEELLGINSAIIDSCEFRFFVFNGQAQYIQAGDLEKYGTRYFYDINWNFQNFNYNHDVLDDSMQRPKELPQIINMACSLGGNFEFVRVDLYVLDSQIYIGELTFTPVGGTGKFTPNEWDKKLGDLWQ